jgi:hypothetical protein
MFPGSSPAFDLSAALAAAQSRLATASVGPGACPEDTLVSSSLSEASSTLAPTAVPDRFGLSQPPVGFSTPSSAGHDPGVLGESFATGGVPGDIGIFSAFIMSSQMASDLCCGEVAGLKLCTAGCSTCSIRKHVKKVNVLIGRIYIAGPRNSAFTQITLDPSLVPTALVPRILSEKLSLDTWQRLFGAISQLSVVLTEDEFESVKSRVLTGTSFGLTPRKGIQRYEDDKISSEYQSSKLSPIGQYKDEDLDMESLLVAQMDKVATFSKDTAQSLDLLRQTVGEDVDRLEAGLQNLTLKVGDDPGISDTPMLSAWEGAEYLHSLLQDFKQEQWYLYLNMWTQSQFTNRTSSSNNFSPLESVTVRMPNHEWSHPLKSLYPRYFVETRRKLHLVLGVDITLDVRLMQTGICMMASLG